ncbi:MAG: hypothetical protein ACOZCL_04165 [Bacillota bacterium]
MNLLSSLLIKDYDNKNRKSELSASRLNEDPGYNSYRTLEYSRKSTKQNNHNLQLNEIINFRW